MLERPIYVVAKVFAKVGSKVFKLCYEEELSFISELMIQAPNNMEIVVLTNLEVYAEYAPYEVVEDFQKFKDYVLTYNNEDFVACDKSI